MRARESERFDIRLGEFRINIWLCSQGQKVNSSVKFKLVTQIHIGEMAFLTYRHYKDSQQLGHLNSEQTSTTIMKSRQVYPLASARI